VLLSVTGKMRLYPKSLLPFRNVAKGWATRPKHGPPNQNRAIQLRDRGIELIEQSPVIRSPPCPGKTGEIPDKMKQAGSNQTSRPKEKQTGTYP
jgi:hypothetical protein